MRELLLRNLTSRDKRRTELFFSEHFEKAGLVQDFEKKTVFSIKEILEFTDHIDLTVYLEQKSKEESTNQTYLIKSHDTEEDIHKYIHKVVGEQFVVLDDKVFIVKVSQYTKRMVSGKSNKTISK